MCDDASPNTEPRRCRIEGKARAIGGKVSDLGQGVRPAYDAHVRSRPILIGGRTHRRYGPTRSALPLVRRCTVFCAAIVIFSMLWSIAEVKPPQKSDHNWCPREHFAATKGSMSADGPCLAARKASPVNFAVSVILAHAIALHVYHRDDGSGERSKHIFNRGL